MPCAASFSMILYGVRLISAVSLWFLMSRLHAVKFICLLPSLSWVIVGDGIWRSFTLFLEVFGWLAPFLSLVFSICFGSLGGCWLLCLSVFRISLQFSRCPVIRLIYYVSLWWLEFFSFWFWIDSYEITPIFRFYQSRISTSLYICRFLRASS